MAVLKGLIRKMSGSAGDFTFSQNQGRTIVSEKITATTNRRTSGQQRTRTKLGNIVHNYQGILPLLDSAFENKAAGVSDYNMFVKMNMQSQAVYLTKTQVSGGACVAAPYAITQGTLPSIVVTTSGNQDVTDIAVGTLTVTATTTVAQFANAVVAANDEYDYGDQISFYQVNQKVNAATSLPYCEYKAYNVVLDKNSSALLLGQVPAEAFAVANGCIAHSAVTGNVAYAWVHSRKSNGKTKVSSQSLVCHNTLLTTYTSEAAYQAAAASYGGENKVFLTPGTTDTSATDGGSSTQTMRTLTVNVSPAGAGTVTGAGQYAQGTNANITATAASGYTFSKWSDDNTNATRSVTVNADMTLTAQFTATGGGGGGDNEGGGYS